MATKTSPVEEAVFNYLKKHNYPLPAREFRFYPERRWRFDFAWPDLMIALEVEGGNYGRHQRRAGFKADCQKYNQAAMLGWSVYRFTTEMIENGEIIDFFKAVFGSR